MILSVGVDNFKNVKNKSVYVDKTKILENILSKVDGTSFLFCRPRRFGKSLALSMMEYFFDEKKKDDSYLFNDLYIAKNKALLNNHQNKYAVVHLNFKDLISTSFDSLISGINGIVRDAYLENISVYYNLNEFNKIYWNK